MCGIFAINGRWTKREISALAERAAQRGPHGWGYAIESHRYVFPEPYDSRRFLLLHGSGPVIGNCRLATSADRRHVPALQPLLFDGFALAHNGTVPDAEDWRARLHCQWETGNDSELIGRALERDQCQWPGRLRAVAAIIKTPFALAIKTQRDIWLIRRGHPVYATASAACSRPFPGAQMIPELSPIRLASDSDPEHVTAEAGGRRSVRFGGAKFR